VASVPPIRGTDAPHVFTLRNIGDMLRIKAFCDERRPRAAAVIGTGFIGLEMCENLEALGIRVTLLEKLAQVTPGLDADMAAHVEAYLTKNGVPVLTGVTVESIDETGVTLTDGRTVEADMVLVSAACAPTRRSRRRRASSWAFPARSAWTRPCAQYPGCLRLRRLRRAVPRGDRQPVWRPLGSTANKTGRIAGDQVTGGGLTFRGVLGTGIFKVFEMTVAQTGLSEREAKAQGYDAVVCHNIKPATPMYLHGR
jgi:NADPH-dependent 2,4-dienoyl-CoA reductase/sulfur reductase-like enzyme